MPEARKEQGAKLNQVRDAINQALDTRRQAFAAEALNRQLESERIDVTLAGRGQLPAGLHPVTRVMNRITEFFTQAGFQVAVAPKSKTTFIILKR
jgi:phenylalanyl-tRNA synthetase alpha chain